MPLQSLAPTDIKSILSDLH